MDHVDHLLEDDRHLEPFFVEVTSHANAQALQCRETKEGCPKLVVVTVVVMTTTTTTA
jgi:hypothetical protein